MSRKKISTTIYVTPEQADRLKTLHERTKVPVAVYIREGIDLVLNHYQHLLPGQLPLDGGHHGQAQSHGHPGHAAHAPHAPAHPAQQTLLPGGPHASAPSGHVSGHAPSHASSHALEGMRDEMADSSSSAPKK